GQARRPDRALRGRVHVRGAGHRRHHAGSHHGGRRDRGRRPRGRRFRHIGERMEFGLFFLMQRDEAWTEPDVYDSGLEQMLAAEALGYSSVWICEHPFNDYGLCPSPPVLAAFVAARTTTLRLGMGVSLLPLHHPVELAEQLAVLDEIG